MNCALRLLQTAALVAMVILPATQGFAPQRILTRNTIETQTAMHARQARKIEENEVYNKKISNSRRKKLGIADDEDEYDLEIALENSTDPFITKVIAGSLILSITALLVAGIIIPATTDYGEGVCNALLTGGRC